MGEVIRGGGVHENKSHVYPYFEPDGVSVHIIKHAKGREGQSGRCSVFLKGRERTKKKDGSRGGDSASVAEKGGAYCIIPQATEKKGWTQVEEGQQQRGE